MTSLSVIQVFAVFNPDDPGAAATVSVSPISGGAALVLAPLIDGGCRIDSDGDGDFFDGTDADCLGTLTNAAGTNPVFTLDAGTVTGLDAGGTANRFRLSLNFTASCGTPTTFTFSAIQNGVPAPTNPTVACSLGATATATNTPAPTATPIPLDSIRCHIGANTGAPVDDEPPACAVVVTATPNVVQCGGRSIITASVRNRDGHAVAGFGYHFSTDNGVLTIGPPPSAEATSALAVLEILPGMSSATVLVSVGLSIGTIEGQVTVQQYCPSSSQTTGGLTLSAASNTVACGSSTFIAATVKDVLGNPVPDATDVNFLATAGSVNPAKATTLGGALNVVYNAPANFAGTVRITVASGSRFATIDLNVVCATTTSGGTTPQRICIGDNVCITPPNTGSGGLKR